MKKERKVAIFLIIVTIILLLVGWLYILPMMTGDNLDLCYKYVNSTNNIQSYMFGKCYIYEYHYYETRKNCGLFGISCYESDESHIEKYRTLKCIISKTGEKC